MDRCRFALSANGSAVSGKLIAGVMGKQLEKAGLIVVCAYLSTTARGWQDLDVTLGDPGRFSVLGVPLD